MIAAAKNKIIPAAFAALVVFSMARIIGSETWEAVLFFSIGYLAKQILDK
jgi:hypothetical protein